MRRTFALVMAGVLALYVVLVGQRALELLRSGEAAGIGMGIALIVFPLLGAWALIVELRFGFRLERLVRKLEAAGGMPHPLPAAPSGRAELEAALAAFPAARDDVHANPDSWESWLRLSMAYDAARDRKRARKAARKALELSRAE